MAWLRQVEEDTHAYKSFHSGAHFIFKTQK